MSEPVAMFKSRRARILYALQLALETIKKENGFATDVYRVTTAVKSWRDVTEDQSPTLYIIDENTQYEYKATAMVERTWSIGLYGVMKNQDQYKMEELIADIEECLAKNERLQYPGEPGPVSYSRITNITTDNQLFSEIEGMQLFKISLNLKYIACINKIR